MNRKLQKIEQTRKSLQKQIADFANQKKKKPLEQEEEEILKKKVSASPENKLTKPTSLIIIATG